MQQSLQVRSIPLHLYTSERVVQEVRGKVDELLPLYIKTAVHAIHHQ